MFVYVKRDEMERCFPEARSERRRKKKNRLSASKGGFPIGVDDGGRRREIDGKMFSEHEK